jgi:hypothetical protein
MTARGVTVGRNVPRWEKEESIMSASELAMFRLENEIAGFST